MGSEDSAQVQKTAPKRNSKLDDEEMMSVLGHPQRRSNDAVSIARPGNRRTPYRHPGGGVQPRNTLTMIRNLPDQRFSSRPSASTGEQHMLSVDVTRGYNVRHARGKEIEDSFESPRSAKRQKVIHPASKSRESSVSTIDDLHPDEVTFGRPLEKNAFSHSQQSGGRSGVQQNMDILNEYRSVEGMMDSNPRNAKRSKGATRRKSLSPLKESLSRKTSVEVVGEAEHMVTSVDTSVESRYMGTLRKQPAPSRTIRVRDSDHKSHAKETHSQYFKAKLSVQPTDVNPNLKTSFVATDGRQRGIDYLSSDELDCPVTLGEHADTVTVSPRRRHQTPGSKSPTAIVKKAGSPSPEVPVERSNIKPTVFHSHTPINRRPGCQETFEDNYLDEEKPSWAVPVAAINLPGQKQMHKSSDMAVVFDKDQKLYFLKDGGRYLRDSNGSILRLYPKTLQKCSREKSGRRIRFESSKRGIEDHVLDLELMTEKDAVALILRIQKDSTNVKVTDLDSTKMQKMFEVRRNQPKSASSLIEDHENMPEDVQMAARNRQRQEARDKQTREACNVQRRRSKIANGLIDNTTSGTAPAGFISNSSSSRGPNGLPSHTTAKPNEGAPGRSGIFDKIRPAHNDHLRRSQRTSGIPNRFLEELEAPQQPKVEKYSVKHGLGNKWSKPLSYPKMGRKKATVEWEDLERLDEGEFLNDNLVSFYMRYLEEELGTKYPNLAKTVYFFNSFFYDRLTTNQKGQKGINYEGVQRWTRGVNLFAYDFIIVPINELTHWYVAIICNLPALDQSMDVSDQSTSLAEAPDEQLNRQPRDSIAEESAPEPEEKEARHSFAEMSLDGKPSKRPLSEDSLLGGFNEIKEDKDAASSGEDDEMLDAPNVTQEGPNPVEFRGKEQEDEPIVDADNAAKLATPTKKQKRKSIPPSITKFDPSGPSIITFDSFGHPHSIVIRTLKQYLYEEGKAKRNIELDVSHVKGITAKNIPQQSNFSDCGLFMLGYVEKFLEDRPKDFIAKIIKREYDDQKDWPKMVPSKMRSNLREQLQRLHEEDQDERRAVAIKAGKLVPGSQSEKSDLSTTKETSNLDREAIPGKLSKPNAEEPTVLHRAVPPDTRSVDLQPGRNLIDVPTAAIEDHVDLASKLENSDDAAAIINDSVPNASVVVIESQTQPEVASKEEQPDAPSSQPLQPPTPGHSMPGSLPTLPSEIEDSQPSQQLPVADLKPPSLPARSKPDGEDRFPENLVLSPEPPSNQDPTEKSQKHTDHQHFRQDTQKDTIETPQNGNPTGITPPALPKRRGRKGIAQKVPTPKAQPSGGGKMTKEEAIVLDDD